MAKRPKVSVTRPAAPRQRRQTPRIIWSPLSRQWYVVTRYTVKTGIQADTGDRVNYLAVQEKFLVTDQMKKILDEHRSRGRKRRG